MCRSNLRREKFTDKNALQQYHQQFQHLQPNGATASTNTSPRFRTTPGTHPHIFFRIFLGHNFYEFPVIPVTPKSDIII